MEFRTVVNIDKGFPISHDDRIMLLGSCFTDEIGNRLERRYFNTCINPFGALYNPISIAKAFDCIINKSEFSEDDIFEHNGLWHSFMHHSRFSSRSKETALGSINASFSKAKEFFKTANVFIITFGTAFIYSLADSGEIVANCHKLPSSSFVRQRVSIETITNRWTSLIKTIYEINPNARIIFTVSPIRHLADGAHGNQISKATLLLAIEELVRLNSSCSYFPSYEIVLDELRDYRFYAADMKHPSDVAVDYIFERFAETFFTKETINKLKDFEKLWKMKNHKPMTDNLDEINKFNDKISLLEKALGLK